MTTPIIDSETLLREILPLARMAMGERGTLAPFGATIDSEGKLGWIGGPDEMVAAETLEAVARVKDGIRGAVRDRACRAAALVYETKVNVPPDDEEIADAIVVSLGHREGYAVDLFYPYRNEQGEVRWGEAFARESMADLLTAA